MSNEAGNKTQQGMEKYFFRASAADFKKIPGSPIAYWIPKPALNSLHKTMTLDRVSEPRKGMCTRDNNYFVRFWPEVSVEHIGFNITSRQDAKESKKRWFPYQKGGKFRQWYGNHNSLVDWENDGYRLKNMKKLGWEVNSTNHNIEYIFKPAIVWSKITSSVPNFRYSPIGFLYDDASGLCHINNSTNTSVVLGLLCSKVGKFYMNIINPTMNIQPGDMASMPFLSTIRIGKIDMLIAASKQDWDSYETSWDFTTLPLLNPEYRQPTLKATYQKLRAHWREMTLEMQRLEEENNRIFIDAYGLQDELTPEVPLGEITLTCNPHYRYGGDRSEDELEALLLADTLSELVSYAVGCMFGRYSLDKPGLILANQGETIADYRKQVPAPLFSPDEDNVIPMLDGDWFSNDIAGRFREFLRIAFGEEHYEENLQFVERGLNVRGRRSYGIRDYFLSEFYNDHVKRYKKRPIYWLFSSPRGSFNALISMHRYRPDTVSVVLNDYLREFRTKLAARKDHLEAVSISSGMSQGEKTKALKEIEKVAKMITEMEEYESKVLYPLAVKQVEIDLDDGVRFNYSQFGSALKKISGMESAED